MSHTILPVGGLPAALNVGPFLEADISEGLALVSGSVDFIASLVVAYTSQYDAPGAGAHLTGKRRDPKSGFATSDLAEAPCVTAWPLCP